MRPFDSMLFEMEINPFLAIHGPVLLPNDIPMV
jgi:hypothetical protein